MLALSRGLPMTPVSLGITGMLERAYLLGGELTFASNPAGGTIVQLQFPILSNVSLLERKAI